MLLSQQAVDEDAVEVLSDLVDMKTDVLELDDMDRLNDAPIIN